MRSGNTAKGFFFFFFDLVIWCFICLILNCCLSAFGFKKQLALNRPHGRGATVAPSPASARVPPSVPSRAQWPPRWRLRRAPRSPWALLRNLWQEVRQVCNAFCASCSPQRSLCVWMALVIVPVSACLSIVPNRLHETHPWICVCVLFFLFFFEKGRCFKLNWGGLSD